MLAAILFALIVLCAGYGTARALGLTKGAVAAATVPAGGLALLSVIATWSGLAQIPPPGPGLLVLGCGLAGGAAVLCDRDPLQRALRAFASEHGVAALVFVAAVGIPILALSSGLSGLEAPLSPHDGAFHVETSDMFRQGHSAASWYPPGIAALFGATLQLAPWVDSAAGVASLGLGLTLLAPVLVFGLGAATWRRLVEASLGSLLLSLTFLFPYYPQVWSGWPLLVGIELVVGVWVIATLYVERPGWRTAVLAAVIVGAIVLVHGTELYSSAIVLAVVAAANWRRLAWRRLAAHLPVAVALALLCAAPYLPYLLHWADDSGAYALGLQDGRALGTSNAQAVDSLSLITLAALGIDLPVRLVLVPLGALWAIRARAARSVLVMTAVFFALAAAATFLAGVPIIREAYAWTWPWSLPYRHLTFGSIGLAMVAAGGGAWIALRCRGWLAGVRSHVARRRLGRAAGLVAVAWVLVSAWALVVLVSIANNLQSSFTSDDAAAMAWLRGHASPGQVVLNDTYADAGIWVPYKAGVPIVFYRAAHDPTAAAEAELVLANVARLEDDPAAAKAACALRVGYLYYGAKRSGWQQRTLPPVEELYVSAALEEVFRRGQAVVFRPRLNCAARS